MLISPPILPSLKLFNPLGGLFYNVTFLTARFLPSIILREQTQIHFSNTRCASYSQILNCCKFIRNLGYYTGLSLIFLTVLMTSNCNLPTSTWTKKGAHYRRMRLHRTARDLSLVISKTSLVIHSVQYLQISSQYLPYHGQSALAKVSRNLQPT